MKMRFRIVGLLTLMAILAMLASPQLMSWATLIGQAGVSAVTSVVPGYATTNLGKREDDAHASLDVGVLALGVESDTPSAKGANNDNAPFLVDSSGAVWTHLLATAGATEAFKLEDAASASADSGILGLFVRKAAAFTDLSAGATDGDYEPGQINLEGALRTSLTASATGGWAVYRNLDIDETTATTTQQLKASAGVLHACTITNDTAATKEYVKFYNAVSLTGSAAGTETPVLTVPTYGVSTVTIPMDYYFDTGMTVAATTALADNDTGAPAGNAVVINCTYK